MALKNPLGDLNLEATQEQVRDGVNNRYSGGKTPVVATVTASGDTTIHTPAAGKKVRVYWASALTDPDESSSPLIKISIGSLEIYRSYAIAHWEVFEGAVDAPVKVNLSNASVVAVTIHLEEIT